MRHYIHAKIMHDETRKNSHYYADVAVHSIPGETGKLSRGNIPNNMEIILNGSGISKARKKILNHFLQYSIGKEDLITLHID